MNVDYISPKSGTSLTIPAACFIDVGHYQASMTVTSGSAAASDVGISFKRYGDILAICCDSFTINGSSTEATSSVIDTDALHSVNYSSSIYPSWMVVQSDSRPSLFHAIRCSIIPVDANSFYFHWDLVSTGGGAIDSAVMYYSYHYKK